MQARALSLWETSERLLQAYNRDQQSRLILWGILESLVSDQDENNFKKIDSLCDTLMQCCENA